MNEEIIYGFRNSAEIYEAAIELHGKENMEKKETRVYNLSSIERIDNIIRNGEFIVLKKHGRIIGIICYKKGTGLISFDGSSKQLPNDWEIGGLLIHSLHRKKGYAKQLFNAIINRLKESGAEHAYAILTGTFDESRKGEVREMSKPAERLCRKFGGQVVGFSKSHGTVYKIPVK